MGLRGVQFARRSILFWAGGLVAAVFFVWALSAIFLSSIVPVQWDEQLEQFVSAPGVIRERGEGWADTAVTSHGLHASLLPVLEGGPSFAVWGDSYVEARQVPPAKRFDALFNVLRPQGALQAAGIGGGGRSVADYYFMIPRYQKLFPSIEGNVIVLAGMDDLLPGRHFGCHSYFATDPIGYVYSECQPSELSMKYGKLVREFRLDFLYMLYTSFRDGVAELMSGGQKVGSTSSPEEVPDAALAYPIDALKAVSKGFLAFVYCPPGPVMRDGIVDMEDEHAHLKERFRQLCSERGVAFIDMTDSFIDLYLQHHLLPRGFFNTPPGLGHFNEHGHRLIADELVRAFEGGEL